VKKIIVAGILGVVVGISGKYYLALGAYSLIPWGIVGLGLGAWCAKREGMYAGALYGFCLCFAFMVAGYTGRPSLASRIPFFIVIGAFGAVCGLALTAVGYFLKLTYTKRGRTP
jgi:hypothetical protein